MTNGDGFMFLPYNGSNPVSTLPPAIMYFNELPFRPIDLEIPSLQELDDEYATSHHIHKSRIPKSEFNLCQLLNIATEVRNVDHCTAVKLIGFGVTNKAYSITLSNGKDIIARLPYRPVINEDRMKSEVGAMFYAKQNLPPEWAHLVPTIYSWDSHGANEVGAPYILMEKMEGSPLANEVNSLTMKQRNSITIQLAQFTAALHGIGSEFDKIGGLYYEKYKPFKIGPLIRNWGEDFRQGPGMDTGPWPSTRAFLMGQVHQLLRKWQVYYYPKVDARGNYKQTNVESVVDFLSALASLVPMLDPGDELPGSLVHTDLHSNNILIDPRSATLSGIIDWEAAGIFPKSFSFRLPRCFGSRTVYSALTPLEPDMKKARQSYIETTQLKHTYIVERSCLQPGYWRRLRQYSDLYKLDDCFALNLCRLEFEELAKWVTEKTKDV